MGSKTPLVIFGIDYPSKRRLLQILTEIQKYYSLDNYLFKSFPMLRKLSNEEIADFFVKEKDRLFKRLTKRKAKVEREWRKIEKFYFEKVEELTGFGWKAKRYRCYLSPIDAGRYLLEINSIVCFGFDERIQDTINTIGEELFHLHFWSCMERIGFTLNKNTFSKYWKLSEAIIAFVLPELGFKLAPSWWGDEIRELERKMLPLWKKRKSFADFLKSATKALEHFSGNLQNSP